MFGSNPASEALAAFPIDVSKASSYQFKKKEVSDEEVAFDLVFDLRFHLGYGRKVIMTRVGGEWKADW
jgi:hypothetical protein